MVAYLKEPKKVDVKSYTKDESNEGKVALFKIDEELLFAEGASDDWVELEEKKESMENSDSFFVVTIPRKNKRIKTMGWDG
ncbi:MAG: hypothetical protein IJ679_06470 [Lachnospiraceae bacterium]|nr:hypothetical protein [Lachnospiraceae bacterium]